jgi:HEPN domain-containing protein
MSARRLLTYTYRFSIKTLLIYLKIEYEKWEEMSELLRTIKEPLRRKPSAGIIDPLSRRT